LQEKKARSAGRRMAKNAKDLRKPPSKNATSAGSRGEGKLREGKKLSDDHELLRLTSTGMENG